ncbi:MULTISPECIES: hypothetical protein [Halococcus]|uniref:DUF8097 domain-containing protein n=1 Tax=Halococcus salifodinae DSM 8989 TaxID=1227456 RepID=M0MYI2_9EURY|nr:MULTISPECIES: hypothetical protein [Halococcus]EMA49460.1 hypothetical protein C450_17217 [Halococcus salifodinae DSM 8989]
MFSRRTKARLSFLSNVLLLPIIYRFIRWRRAAGDDESLSLVPQWFLAGVGYQAAYYWAYDHDFGAIRTSRWRRTLFSGVQSTLMSKLFSLSEGGRLSFLFGGNVGAVVYRLWYGVLRPLPGSDE